VGFSRWPASIWPSVFGEFFNLFNISNLSYANFTLDPVKTPQTFPFGLPTDRVTQVFGSGGPRSIQVGRG
jgi:hypothetical protein